VRTFEWDARNQLVAVNIGTHRSEFTYDGEQHRVRIVEKENSIVQSDTAVIWCHLAICEERSADGAVTRRSFSLGEQVAGTARFFASDHLGSIAVVTDNASVVLSQYAFDPWGRRTVTAGTDTTNVGYAGHRWQAADGLSLTLYRGYDPELGRWISEDPIGSAGGLNLYAYVENRPASLTDSSGLSAYLYCEQIPSTRGGNAIGFLGLLLSGARHCYIRVICPGKYDATLELYGPQPGAPNGRPQMNLPNPERNAKAEMHTIYPRNPDNAECCKLENALVLQFNLHQPPPPYNALGPNSNTFAAEIIKAAGGITHFPGSAIGFNYNDR
jgi:RHS repeat-associated protein